MFFYQTIHIYTAGGKSTKEEQYSEIVLPHLRREDTIKMDSNPSYHMGQGTKVDLQPNPSYGVNKSGSKINDDEYDYVQSTEFAKHHDRGDDVNMETNPSCRVVKGEGNITMGHDVIIEPNPSYEISRGMITDTKATPDSDVIITPCPAYDGVTEPATNECDDDNDYI